MNTNKKVLDIIESIKTLSAIEINELVKKLEVVFEVKSSMQGIRQGSEATVDNTSGNDDEKDEVSLILKSVGASKVAVIKLIKDVLAVDLMKAKKISETVPTPLKEKISRSDADEISQKFIAVGAETEIK